MSFYPSVWDLPYGCVGTTGIPVRSQVIHKSKMAHLDSNAARQSCGYSQLPIWLYLEASFFAKSRPQLYLTGIREVGVPRHIFPTLKNHSRKFQTGTTLGLLRLRKKLAPPYLVHFSTGNRFLKSRSLRNDDIASKILFEVTVSHKCGVCSRSHSGISSG